MHIRGVGSNDERGPWFASSSVDVQLLGEQVNDGDDTDEAASALLAKWPGVGHLRNGIEGLRRFDLHDAAVLTPSVGLGLLHDVGDDASGAALDLGAGLR